MSLSKNQKKILKTIIKNDNTIIYSDLHADKHFKTDYAVQSAVESLYRLGYISFVVYKSNPEGLTNKSTNDDEIIKDRFVHVKYFQPSNRLLITEKGVAYIEELKDATLRYWIPVTLTLFFGAVQFSLSVFDIFFK